MVFGLFSRPKPSDLATQVEKVQLRTPSPSALGSGATAPIHSSEPGAASSKHGLKRRRSESPIQPMATIQDNVMLPPPASPAELLHRIKKIPPKTLHTYVVSHLPQATTEVADTLLVFFATLQPPPRLHCVRCHKDYTEVENTDRSCLIAHDDESAEVMRAGLNKVGSKYETHYACCNKIVEGEGDLGPPDGWCFEGFHTMDVKRARFRADSTIEDDKLRSCTRNKCFFPNGIDTSGIRGRSQRAAARKSIREANSSDDEELDERELAREAKELAEGSDEGQSVSTGMGRKATPKTKPRKRKTEPETAISPERAEAEKEGKNSPSVSVSVSTLKSKAKSMKPKSSAKSKVNATLTPPPTTTETTTSIADVEMAAPGDEAPSISAPGSPQQPKLKKPRKPRKSTGTDGAKYKPPKDEGESSEPVSDNDKPKRKKARRKSTAPAQID